MLIKDIEKDSRVTITAKQGSISIELKTVAVETITYGLLTKIMTYDKELINFDSDNVSIDAVIENSKDNKVDKWDNIKIKTILYNGKQYLNLLICNNDVESINRRNGYRMYVGLEGVAQLGANQGACDILVKDISCSGIAFICDKDVNLCEDDLIRITFQDKKLNKNFDLKSLYVRKEILENGVLYGCRFKQNSEIVGKYVAEKQIIQIKGKQPRNNYMR